MCTVPSLSPAVYDCRLFQPTENGDGRKLAVSRDSIKTRHGLPSDSRKRAWGSGAQAAGGSRRAPEDRRLSERADDQLRGGADVTRTGRQPELRRTGDEQQRTEEDRSHLDDRTVEETRTIQEDGRDKTDQTLTHRQEIASNTRNVFDREAEMPGSLPSISKVREPGVQGELPLRKIADNRGVNWVPSRQSEFPFLVRLSSYYQKPDGSWFYEPCGASILSNTYILTAAHCFDKQKLYNKGDTVPKYIYAYLNDFDTNKRDESKITTAKSVKLHPSYDETGHPTNDIALVELKDRLDFTALKVNKICIDSTVIGGNRAMTIAGWGKTSESATKMNTKLYKSTNEKTLTTDDCKATKYDEDDIDDRVICATGDSQFGIQDACQGDSGGPMFYKVQSQFKQTGIVSWGSGCAEEGYPGIYTRVSKFAQWVEDNSDATVC